MTMETIYTSSDELIGSIGASSAVLLMIDRLANLRPVAFRPASRMVPLFRCYSNYT